MKVCEPYLTCLYHPMKVKFVYGPAAMKEPLDPQNRVNTRNQNFVRAVGEYWFSSFLPDCAAPEKPDECMNIIHEGDWRAFIQDCYALEELYEDNGWDWWWSDEWFPEDHPRHPIWWEGQRTDGMPRYFPNWLVKAESVQRVTDQGDLSNAFVTQIHNICTAAHRWVTEKRPQGSGDVICFAWKGGCNGGPGFRKTDRQDFPSRWNGMWGITTRAARQILKIAERGAV